MYQLLRRFLFLFDAEAVHHFAMNIFGFFCKTGLRKIIAANYTVQKPGLAKEVFGLAFRNPVGLAAGFDKNALYLDALEALGFGCVEIGTVTPKPQPGNNKPRLFRLPVDKALVNRMGFNNDGVEAVAGRIRKYRDGREAKVQGSASGVRSSEFGGGSPEPASWELDSLLTTINAPLIIGGNIGKNKTTPNEEAWKDYETCFRALFDCVDYFVVNVSSPNTPGLRELQEKEALKQILVRLQGINREQARPRPLLLKIAPDLSKPQLDDVIDLAMEIALDGLVAANTTVGREGLVTSPASLAAIGGGGLSGMPLKKRTTEIVRYIHQKTGGALPIIASGGIFTAADARENLEAGADLVQVWTGFIYEGPAVVKKICKGI